MPRSFFSRHALLVLCIVFFLVPFGLRGARLSVSRTKNNVVDWLPKAFKETKELEFFADHFVGEKFVVASWPGCTAEDPRYDQLLELVREEVEPHEPQPLPTDPQARDDELARRMGAELGLFDTGDYHENWGGRGERWLQGRGSHWYYITPDGKLYRWTAGDGNLGRAMRAWRVRRGGKVDGELVEHWQPVDPERYFDDPKLLSARLFGSVLTGPLAVDQMAQEGGALWPLGNVAEEDKPVLARRRAMERLEGTLFGPIIPTGFRWTVESLEPLLSEANRARLPAQWREVAEERMQRIADYYFDGSREQLAAAPSTQTTRHWYTLCDDLNIEPPAPTTCFFVTLSEVGDKSLSRVCGRQMLGKPRGKLLALAEASGVPSIGPNSVLHMGGPPVDNVAIDEEGSVTLMRLVGFSAMIGIVLSYLSFRSVVATIMVFLVGGISAMASLAIVYWSDAEVDAVLLSMPSLVYVLGLSGAVHIVNYYRDAVQEHGLEGAPGRALRHGWGPCTLAAFTTALGLLSLYASNILPIRKFGLYSALGVMATLVLLFTYLPAALTLWPTRYAQRKSGPSTLTTSVNRFWDRVGGFVTRRYKLVIGSMVVTMAVLSLGLFNIKTSVQLLKLFDADAKIIRDYQWLEDELGELVPMEVVVRVPATKIRDFINPSDELGATDTSAAASAANAEVASEQLDTRMTLLERVQMIDILQGVIEREFGQLGKGYVGRGLSVATFAYNKDDDASDSGAGKLISNQRLERRYPELLGLDYLRRDKSAGHEGAELWRISLRLGALNGVDYGEFVHELADAVEPALAAFRHRDRILRQIDVSRRAKGEEPGYHHAQLLLLGAPEPYDKPEPEDANAVASTPASTPDAKLTDSGIDQTRIYSETLQQLLWEAGFVGDSAPYWEDPETHPIKDTFASLDEFGQALAEQADCVVLVRDHPELDPEFLKQHANAFVDARDHQYHRPRDPATWLASGQRPVEEHYSLTAAERGGDEIHAIYTGVIPVVYKAQRTLLHSLAESIGWAFVMIAVVMMVLLRSGPMKLDQMLSFRGGLLSMVPNVFPVIITFGWMGHRGVLVDIGTMMTASVAMGVAVDDTIHFLTWFRSGVRMGLERVEAVKLAYERCATAMTQTTLIGGVGLSVFAVSTFTPTQRFGVMMLVMLAGALVGDLILLPALLASPWGRFFCPQVDESQRKGSDSGASGATSLDVPSASSDEPSGADAEASPAAASEDARPPSSSATSMSVRVDNPDPGDPPLPLPHSAPGRVAPRGS
ncbi:MAG: MMPL family transporter [Planctomycetales bacterium]|nr:MMPL family transporter [Planctomycetales bacterium]